MLKKLHSLKSKKGFTLVELIIVIAIIAVLAAILIPTMMGFVKNSRLTSNNATAKQIEGAVTSAIVELEGQRQITAPASATIRKTSGGTSVTSTAFAAIVATGNGDGAKAVAALGASLPAASQFTVVITNGKVVSVSYSTDSTVPTAIASVTPNNQKSNEGYWPAPKAS